MTLLTFQARDQSRVGTALEISRHFVSYEAWLRTQTVVIWGIYKTHDR